jgi:cytochrome c
MTAGLVLAGQEKPSIELGRKLFNEVQPGITGKTCADCHKDGAGLEKSGSSEHHPAMINKCATNALHGKPLATDSVEMQSLMLYINSLKAKKKAPVGC